MSELFVSLQWLADRLHDPRLRIVDTRNVPHGAPTSAASGPEQYASGHVPDAIYLDYAVELADPATPYAARVAGPDDFARVVGDKGIGNDAIVVAYDAGTVPYAARIVWDFFYYGHTQAYILAGGLPAWVSAGRALSFTIPDFAPATFTPRVKSAIRATRDEVLAAATTHQPTVQLLETQRDSTYAMRDHDIAGAIRLSGSVLLEDNNGGRVASVETLTRLIADRQLDREKRTIVSCGSGVSAAGSYFALKSAGFSDVAVYDGSWLEWKHDNLPSVAKPPA